MSIRRGYETISNGLEHEEEELLNTPLRSTTQARSLQNRQEGFMQKIKNFDYQHFCRTKFHPRFLSSFLFCITLVGLVSVAVTFGYFLPNITTSISDKNLAIQPPISAGISATGVKQGLEICQNIKQSQAQRYKSDTDQRVINPRAPKDIRPILLKNAVVWDGQGQILNNVDILLANGVISKVEQSIQAPPPNTKIIDVRGHVVSPGLVDMHTHLGVGSWPAYSANDDVNEETEPITPYVRALDAFNPGDIGIRIVASGGITTALVLPGSGNVIGGEAYVFKLRPVNTTSNEEMLVQSGIDEGQEQKWRYMKMACGENPKKVYGRYKNRMPSTRMGEAYLFRQAFSDAQSLMQAQDDWCSTVENLFPQDTQNTISASHVKLDSRFPQDLKLEHMVALLRGQVKLNVHCYETQDIEAMIRHSDEFNFDISAFHHAIEAYRIPDILKRAKNNITVATFADHWGYKKEAFAASPEAPKILFEAGIPVALKSDHPVLNSQRMAFEAAKATHYGLPPQEAFKAITSVPANALGLGHRVGSLKVGYDADVVIWDRAPLELGASPLQVFIDGLPLFDEKPIESFIQAKNTEKKKQLLAKDNEVKDGTKNFKLVNIGSNFLNSRDHQKNSGDNMSVMIVQNGKVVCSSSECELSTTNIGGDYQTIDVQGGYILPGLVAVGSKLGLIEIPSELSTGDGVVPSSASYKTVIEAVDGLKLGGKKLQEAYKGGVLTIVTSPISNNLVMGVSVAFKTNAESILSDGSLISSVAALHFQIGNSVKSTSYPTVSSQISFLRQTFIDNIRSDNRYGQAARGEIPLVISVDNKDEIASIILLREKHIPKSRMAIMGGAESHLLAPQLAKANIAVILLPSLCTPHHFDILHCLTGAPLTNGTAAHVLHHHGVKIGLGVLNDGWARNLAWDAGWLAATSPSKEMEITEAEAIKFVTTNLQEIFGLDKHKDDLGVQQDNEFVVWSGSPMDMQSRPLFAHTSEWGMQSI